MASQEPSEEAEEAEDLAYANAALLRVTRRLDDAAGGLSELAVSLRSAGDDPEQLGAAEQVLDQIPSLKDILRRIRKRGRKHQNPGDAFSVVTQVTALPPDHAGAVDRQRHRRHRDIRYRERHHHGHVRKGLVKQTPAYLGADLGPT